MKVIIVRHAQTNENLKGGDAARDSEALLTEEGVFQAKKLGHHLKDYKITQAYTSPQKRAIDTAQEVLAYHVEAKIDHIDDLREQNLGKLSGLPKNTIREMHKQTGLPFADFRPEEGESYGDVQKRAAKFFHELLQKHKQDDTILIVTHGGTLGVLLLHILEKELTEENYKAHKSENTAFTMIEITDDKKFRPHKINSLEHLN
ncbi:MAG: histidine phosphatase family protein [Candidatus Staskawiczbacteria bacterium]|nr:histidine phosphatase family protein [Candidatus Staskawiczbacteria bacterium]